MPTDRDSCVAVALVGAGPLWATAFVAERSSRIADARDSLSPKRSGGTMRPDRNCNRAATRTEAWGGSGHRPGRCCCPVQCMADEQAAYPAMTTRVRF